MSVRENTAETVAHALVAEFISLLGGRSEAGVLDSLLQRCRSLTRAEAGALYAQRPSATGESLVAVAVQGSPAIHIQRAGADALATRAFDTMAPAYLDGIRAGKSGPAAVPGAGGPDCWSALAIPLRNHGGIVVGAIALINRRDGGGPAPFSDADVAVLAPVNAVIGDAIERRELMMRLVGSNEELRRQNRDLDRQRARIEALGRETEAALRTSVTLLAKAAELHDEDTGNHILRVDRYAETLAERLGMPADFREEIGYSAALHDVGKMSVDAALLKKTGPLTLPERTEMERHTTYGYEILRQSERLRMAAEIAWSHHERWDGGGYPRGLAGGSIPLSARIVAVGDVYDALRSPRPYKTARSHAVARDWMLRDLGHFDPEVIGCFADHHQDFEAIYETLVDRRKRPIA